jgi:kynurenine formamidase
MNKLILTLVTSVVAMFVWVGASFADGHCNHFADIRGKAWVDGDCMETPLGEKWWPHPIWGADDQAGSTNWYKKPEVVKRALAMVKEGKTMQLGHPYTSSQPMFGARKFVLRIPGAPTGGAFGPNKVMWNDEFLSTEIGQAGTQFDGLGHIGVQVGADGDKNEMRWYNGITVQEMNGAYGLNKLGLEHLNPIIARGVLLDIAAVRGVDVMEVGDMIKMADVKAALKAQGMSDYKMMPGDAILFHTGWDQYWVVDNTKYNSGCPGIGMEVARWISGGNAGVTGFDTWPGDAVPNEDPDCVFCVHQYLQTRHGIINQENLNTSKLVDAGVYEFAYIYNPVPIVGATGSIGHPTAMW